MEICKARIKVGNDLICCGVPLAKGMYLKHEESSFEDGGSQRSTSILFDPSSFCSRVSPFLSDLLCFV